MAKPKVVSGIIRRGRISKDGREELDTTPVAVPAGFKRPDTLAEQVRRLVQTSVSEWASRQGAETFEESEDFDIPDDPLDRASPYETYFDPILGKDLTVDEFRRNEAVYKEQFLARQAKERYEAERAALISEAEVQVRKKRFRKPADPAAPPAPHSTKT